MFSYSERSATIGSTRAARRAGGEMQPARRRSTHLVLSCGHGRSPRAAAGSVESEWRGKFHADPAVSPEGVLRQRFRADGGQNAPARSVRLWDPPVPVSTITLTGSSSRSYHLTIMVIHPHSRLQKMKFASVSVLKAKLSQYLDAVKRGEEVMVTDRGETVARLSPVRGRRGRASRLSQLVRSGRILAPRSALPADFWQMERPVDKTGRTLAALLEEREEGR